MKLNGKIAIVTGGSNGIGSGIVEYFLAAGASVINADIVPSDNGATYIETDISDTAAVDQLFEQVIEQFGRLDILVNNAALVHYPPANVNFLELSDDTFRKNIAISLTGTFLCSSRAARIMAKQVMDGTAATGSIINISSGGGSRSHRHLASYDTSKGGLEALTRSMALDLAPWNIRAVSIAPGNIAVGAQLSDAYKGNEAAKNAIPLGRPGTPADIGAACVFIASDDGAYITGTNLYVDGGMDAQLRSPGIDVQIDRNIVNRNPF